MPARTARREQECCQLCMASLALREEAWQVGEKIGICDCGFGFPGEEIGQRISRDHAAPQSTGFGARGGALKGEQLDQGEFTAAVCSECAFTLFVHTLQQR